jgi:acyl carrier protein
MDLDQHAQIRAYVASRLSLHGDIAPLGDEDTLFTSARLDSLDAVELVIFLETDFGIDFSKLGFDLTLLNSVSAISDLVSRHTVGA